MLCIQPVDLPMLVIWPIGRREHRKERVLRKYPGLPQHELLPRHIRRSFVGYELLAVHLDLNC
jgi:hypothetical protein